MYPGGDPNKWVYVAITTFPMVWVGEVDLIRHIARRLVFNIAGVARASEVPSTSSFPSHLPCGLVCMDGLDVVSSSNASANGTPSFINRFRLACDRLKPRWETGGQGVLCTHSRRGVRRRSWYFSSCTGQRPVLGVHNFVPLGLCLPCNTVWACVPSRLAFAVLCSLSSRKCTVMFWKGTRKTRSFQGWFGC